MTEERVSFLYKLASNIPDAATASKQTEAILKSHYLMRCHEITKSFGLPAKQFSSNLRCSHCCTEWTNGNYQTKIRPVKLSKKQRKRIRSLKDAVKNQEKTNSERLLLHSNQLERICFLCKHSTIISMKKPSVLKQPSTTGHNSLVTATKTKQQLEKMPNQKKVANTNILKQKRKNITEINVYSSTKDVFSLQNKNNNIAGTVKEATKVIKNNKKKKDKFAGLSKAAVLASAKIARGKESENKLSLFLKPSS